MAEGGDKERLDVVAVDGAAIGEGCNGNLHCGRNRVVADDSVGAFFGMDVRRSAVVLFSFTSRSIFNFFFCFRSAELLFFFSLLLIIIISE